jgi:histidinol-phosphate aminotransferase
VENLINLIRADLRNFNPYHATRDEIDEGSIWLDANESPFAFSLALCPLSHPANQEDGAVAINRYPRKISMALMQQLTSLYKVPASQMILTRGSDDAIDLLIRLFCQAGKDAIMTCVPTFSMYSLHAQLQGALVVEVPLTKGYQLDLPLMISSWSSHVKIIFLCSPNNPTGNLIKEEDVLYLCQFFAGKSIIVVDEAYIEYANAESLATQINLLENLVILRTFSKAYAAAGARCGLLFANKELVQWLMKIAPPYALSSLTLETIRQATLPQHLRLVKQQVDYIKSERARLYQFLKNMDTVQEVFPSEANFYLLQTDHAKKIVKECTEKGIVLRSFHDRCGLENCLRVSIGLREENNQFLKVLEKIR